MLDTQQPLEMLKKWSDFAETHWHPIPGYPGLGCYGTGYDNWGVQTNQKYLGAMAVLGARGDGRALERALAALRYSLATHKSGQLRRTDGKQWGHTWISTLGIERMMYGVHLIERHLTDEDREAMRRVFVSEANWIQDEHVRGQHRAIVADKWASSGKNHPESNVWAGATLWRVAEMYPDANRADEWRDRARDFLINGVSVPDDEKDQPRFVGAGFFPNYALDHHGYLNVGYMVICTSNAALLHFDIKAKGFAPLAELHHHQADLWNVVRKMIFADGRLARIGGDSRVRYAYCQEYLLPSLLYAADHHGDRHALELARRQVDTMAREQDAGADGSFYAVRLPEMAANNPYYYTRLESDRAAALAMAIAYAPLVQDPGVPETPFEESVRGGWCEPEHGAALHRSPTRLASFSWRAFGLTQGMCLPPDDGDLADWERNLAGLVDPPHLPTEPSQRPLSRRLLDQTVQPFEGGFLAFGRVMEGEEMTLAEGWKGADAGEHRIAFAALPDDRIVVGLQFAKMGEARIFLREVQGMHLNVPNDLFNGFRRTVFAESGEHALQSPAEQDGVLDLNSRWANVDNVIGAVGLYGAESMSVVRSKERRGGKYRSLYVEELAWHSVPETRGYEAGSVALDAGWAVASSVDAEETRRWAEENTGAAINAPGAGCLRAIKVKGFDGKEYVVAANFGDEEAAFEAPEGRDLATGKTVGGRTVVAACTARVFRVR